MGDILYLETFGKAFIPKKIRVTLREYLLKAGLSEVPYKFFGGLFWVTLVITYLIYFSAIYNPLRELGPVATLVVTFVAWFAIQSAMVFAVIMMFYFFLNIKIYNRTIVIEKVLPEYLTLVSTNLKGGLSFDKSLWTAIRPEFDILAKEMTLASKKVLTGSDIAESLLEFGAKYDSPQLRRSLNLIVSEFETGGKVAAIIDKVIDNLKKTAILKQEMAAATVTYTIFMTAIVLFITPALFALAQQLLVIIIGVTKSLAASGGSVMGGGSGNTGAGINPNDFKTFSMVAIGIISTFSSMIISIISKGNVKGGVKYIPVFIGVALLIFLSLSNVLAGFFGGLN